MTDQSPRTWETYTYRCTRSNGDIYYLKNSGDLRMLRLYGISEPIVRVRLVEGADGQYRGWLDAKKPEELVMLSLRHIFNTQFTYGYEAEAARGRGEAVLVTVEELEEVD